MNLFRNASLRFVLSLGMLWAFAPSARAQNTPLAGVALKGPYLGQKESHALPLNGKPTLVVILELGRSLVPMELIRAARAAGQFAGRAELAVVFVGSGKDSPEAVDVTLEQKGILTEGLHREVTLTHLIDPERELWTRLGKPRLPYVVLVAADGSLAGEELFYGLYEADTERLAACVGKRPVQSSLPRSADALTEHPFYRAAAGTRPLAPTGHRDFRVEAARRVDAKSISAAMIAHNQAAAVKTIEAYIGTTSNFTGAAAFAKALVDAVGAQAAPVASAMLRTGASGHVLVSSFRNETMIQMANASPDLGMYITIRAALMSRWDQRPLGEVTRTYSLQPSAALYTSEKLFEPLLCGWGDYRAVSTVEVTMSSGDYPAISYRDPLTRTIEEDFLFVPRNEGPGSEANPDRGADESLLAFRSGLSESLRAIQRARFDAPADEKSVIDTISGAVSDLFSKITSGGDAPAPALSRTPFRGVRVARWVQGKDSCSPAQTGEEVGGFGGKVVLLDFMFVTCPPCRAMLPRLSALHERYKDRGFAVVSVAPTWGSKGLRSLIEEKALTHAFAELAEAEDKRWEVTGFPTLVLLDRKGDVRLTLVGTEPEEAVIEQLLNEPPPAK